MRYHLWFLTLGLVFAFALQQHKYWEVNRPLHELPIGNWEYVYDIAWNPNGQQLALATNTGLWLFENLVRDPIRLSQNDAEVTTVAWHWNGLRIASGDNRGVIRVWDMNPDSPLYLTAIQFLQDSGTIHSLAWSPAEGNDRCMIPLAQLRKEDRDIVACMQDGAVVDR